MTLIRVRVVLLMGLRGEPAAGSKRTGSGGWGWGWKQQRMEICEAVTASNSPPQPIHTIKNTCTRRHKDIHTLPAQGIVSQTSQKMGLAPMKRTFGSKTSSLWEVQTRHSSVAQKYSLPLKGINIHAGMWRGKKRDTGLNKKWFRGCFAFLRSPSTRAEDASLISFTPECNREKC